MTSAYSHGHLHPLLSGQARSSVGPKGSFACKTPVWDTIQGCYGNICAFGTLTNALYMLHKNINAYDAQFVSYDCYIS